MREWLNDRIKWPSAVGYLSRKAVPRHRYSFWYLFGGLTLFFLLVQLLTGMLLMVYYSPTPNTAHESVDYIIAKVPLGWLVRSLHSWSSNLMIFTLLVHFLSTFFMKAYRRPRELMWLTGILLLFLALGFGFTGYLLPWDTTAYFATQIGTEIPRSIPVLGDFAVTLLRGGEFVADESLKRLFALHVVVLPIVTLLLAFIHLVLNQVQGTSIPIGVKSVRTPTPFYPDYVYRDLIAWVAGLLVLFWFALLLPVHLGAKADPFASAPAGIKPEWYFLPLYQTLRFVPAVILGLNSEMLVNAGVLLIGLLLIAVPFLDRKAGREEPSRVFTVVGATAVLYMAVAIMAAYFT